MVGNGVPSGQPGLGGHHVGVAARAAVADLVDAHAGCVRAGRRPRPRRAGSVLTHSAAPGALQRVARRRLDRSDGARGSRAGRSAASRLSSVDSHHSGRPSPGSAAGWSRVASGSSGVPSLVEDLVADLTGEAEGEAGAGLGHDVGGVVPALLLPLQRGDLAARVADALLQRVRCGCAGRGRPAGSRRRRPAARQTTSTSTAARPVSRDRSATTSAPPRRRACPARVPAGVPGRPVGRARPPRPRSPGRRTEEPRR